MSTMTTNNLEEARDFAKSLESYVGGLCYLGDHFQAAMLKKASEVINNLIAEIADVKENEREKETFPPAPPIKKKGKQEKATTTTTRARACTREGCSYPGPSWEDVLAYAKHQRVKIDPDYALWWFGQMGAMGWADPDNITEPVRNWKNLLRVWWGERAKDPDDWRKPKEELPRKYPREDWILCAERCRHFDERICRCRCGCAVPPNKREYPQTPEQCERYHKKTNEKKEGAK